MTTTCVDATPTRILLGRPPLHIALIPDGNRRWARLRGLPTIRGHEAGALAVDTYIDVCVDVGAHFITAWPFSTHNWLRSQTEVLDVFTVLEAYLQDRRRAWTERGFRFRVIGDLGQVDAFCPSLAATVRTLERETEDNDAITLTMALNYNGRVELARAMSRMMEAGIAPHEVNPDRIRDHLDTAGMPDPDIVVRTGGDSRLSGFMLFQCEYSELVFTETLMPDLAAAELHAMLESYSARRFSQ